MERISVSLGKVGEGSLGALYGEVGSLGAMGGVGQWVSLGHYVDG